MLDPRNVEILAQLMLTYRYLRRYGDCERVISRLIDLDPSKPGFKVLKADLEVKAKAILTSYRTALATLPSSMNDDPNIASARFNAAVLARDWTSAKELSAQA